MRMNTDPVGAAAATAAAVVVVVVVLGICVSVLLRFPFLRFLFLCRISCVVDGDGDVGTFPSIRFSIAIRN